MCYRCAASNQSPKTSPEDNSSTPPLLPSDDLSEKIEAPAVVNVGERILEKLNGNI
jgi:hypothetical protein